jgi:hypothetical protein
MVVVAGSIYRSNHERRKEITAASHNPLIEECSIGKFYIRFSSKQRNAYY